MKGENTLSMPCWENVPSAVYKKIFHALGTIAIDRLLLYDGAPLDAEAIAHLAKLLKENPFITNADFTVFASANPTWPSLLEDVLENNKTLTNLMIRRTHASLQGPPVTLGAMERFFAAARRHPALRIVNIHYDLLDPADGARPYVIEQSRELQALPPSQGTCLFSDTSIEEIVSKLNQAEAKPVRSLAIKNIPSVPIDQLLGDLSIVEKSDE